MIARRSFLKGVAASAAALAASEPCGAATKTERPNVVFILADDIGYGDVCCYGATKVKTPNIDRIAIEGLRFTDAHSTASVCTPTRYSFMTGKYAWRNRAGDHILSGVAPLSIDPSIATTPSILRQAGYKTGIVGKWHLGLGTAEQPVDYGSDIKPGPLDVGFEYAFFFPATGDRVPCVYIEGRRVVGFDPSDPIRVSYTEKVGDDPTGADHPEQLKMKADRSHSQTIVNGISRIGYMSGGKSARWVDEDMADTLTGKAVAFIEQSKDRPFFLYFAPNDIHEPMAPNPRFKGTSACGTRGDVIHELDWSVGEILAALDRLDLARNTLVVFTSDNGGAIKDTYDDGTNSLHARQAPNGILRGEKASLYEGGHRVPFIARWPGRIKAGTTSDALIGLIDMMATFAAVAKREMPTAAGPDSFNVLPALLGENRKTPVRDHLVLQINGAEPLGLRQGPWKLVTRRPAGKGDAGGLSNAELYNLAEDLGEKNNLAAKYPDKVREMMSLLNQVRENGRSQP
jgi:arylsulfatase A-like enzyme